MIMRTDMLLICLETVLHIAYRVTWLHQKVVILFSKAPQLRKQTRSAAPLGIVDKKHRVSDLSSQLHRADASPLLI
jgi:hypothetical protein